MYSGESVSVCPTEHSLVQLFELITSESSSTFAWEDSNKRSLMNLTARGCKIHPGLFLKALEDVNLAKDIRANKRSFCRSKSRNKRRTRDDVDPARKDMGLRYPTFFASFFTCKCSRHELQKVKAAIREMKNFVLYNKNGSEHLRNLKVHMIMGSDKIQLWVPREMTKEEAEPLCIVFERSQQSSVVSLD